MVADQNPGAAGHEPPLEPDLPIIDAHHHLRDRGGERYLAAELADDIVRSGHRVVATVAVETGYRHDEEAGMAAPVGETRFLGEVAEATQAPGARRTSGSGSDPAIDTTRSIAIASAIVGYANLSIGAPIKAVLQAHIAAGRGRFRGIRQSALWHPDPYFRYPRAEVAQHALLDRGFQAGFAELAPLGLSFDAWLYADQLGDLIELARNFPTTAIALNHVGGPISRPGPLFESPVLFKQWQSRLQQVARCDNIVVKLGGLGLPMMGFGLDVSSRRPDSVRLATVWRPYLKTAIDVFGPDRCLFESNFPPDKASCSYGNLWNAFKRIAAPYAAADRDKMFAGNAARFYRIDL